MSRSFVRAASAGLLALALPLGALVAVQPATAAAPVEGVRSNPVPPEKASISWDAFTGFTVDHYVVRVNPGSGVYDTPGPGTTQLIDDLGWGTTYTVRVFAVEQGTGTLSDAGELVMTGVKLRANLAKVHAVRGQFRGISGSLTDSKDKPLANKTIQLQVRPMAGQAPKFRNLKKIKTNGRGAFATKVKATQSSIYRVLYDQANTAGGWDSNMGLNVHVPISLKFPRSVSFHQQVRFRGVLDAPGPLVAGARIKLQERVNGHWRTRKASNVRANARYTIRYTPTSQVNHAWRVFTQAGPSFATSTSKGKLLIVN